MWAHTEPGGLLGLCSAQGSLSLIAVKCWGGQAPFQVGRFGCGWMGDAEQGWVLQLVCGAGPGAWCCAHCCVPVQEEAVSRGLFLE